MLHHHLNFFFSARQCSRTIYLKISIGLLTLLLLFSVRSKAQGNLLVTPRRVVFEGSKKSAELNLANIGKDTARFVISFIQIRMKEDGSFEEITQPDSAQRFADKFIRFFPRSVTLAPNEAQSVKVQLIKTGELQPGEYRSHLYFRAIASEQPLGERDVQKEAGISVQLIPVFGVSLPLIIRQGESSARVTLSQLSFQMEKDTLPYLKLNFSRSGNMSVYGDLLVDHISPEGKIIRVGLVKGIAVYTPNTERNFNLVLDRSKGINYHKGKLHITYTDQSPQSVKLTEKEIVLQ